VQDAWAKLESHTEMAVFRLLGLATALTLYLSYWDVYRQPLLPEFRRYVDAALDDVKLGPGRVAIFALWMAFLWLLLKRNEGVVLRTIGRVLEPLGQNSLYVYVVHSLVLFPLAGHRTQDFWQASLRGALVVLLIWLMVRRRVLFSVIPR
jgi:hypothetical protein